MKNLFLLFVFVSLFSFSLRGQTEAGSNKFGASYYFFENGFSSSRVSLEGISSTSFTYPKFGFWGKVEYTKEFTPNNWINSGYDQLEYGANLIGCLTYGNNLRYMAGLNVSSQKCFLGPIVGIAFDKGKFNFLAYGVYSIFTEYKSHYDENYNPSSPNKQIIINGFDPNSYYYFHIQYLLNKYMTMGVISERFYVTGVEAEYILPSNIRFVTSFGRNFEFNKNIFSLGVKVVNL